MSGLVRGQEDAPPAFDDTLPHPADMPGPAFDDTLPHPQEIAALQQNAAPTQISAPVADPSALEALLRGGAQGATLGFGDEIVGGGEALLDKVLGKGGDASLSDLYSKHTEEARAANAAAEKAHPYLYAGGNLAGGFASGALTGGLGAESALGRIGTAAGAGALGGVGFSNAENVTDAAAQALKGAALGGVAGTVGEGVRKLLNPDAIEKFAQERTVAALGGEKGIINKITGMKPEKILPVGETALDEGVISPFAGTKTMRGRVDDLLKSSGEGVGGAIDTVDSNELSTFSPKELFDRMTSDIGSKFHNGPAARASGESRALNVMKQEVLSRFGVDSMEEVSPGVMQKVRTLPDDLTVPLSEIQDMKEAIRKLAYPGGFAGTPTATKAAKDVFRQGEGIVSGMMDDTIDKAGQALGGEASEMGAKLLKDKATYSSAKKMDQLLQNREARDLGNSYFSLSDKMAAGAGYLGEGPKGLIAAGANKVVREYGNQTAAWAADKLADVVRKTPEALGPWAKQLQEAAARGGGALASTNYVLQQTSPDFRRHMKDLFDKDGK